MARDPRESVVVDDRRGVKSAVFLDKHEALRATHSRYCVPGENKAASCSSHDDGHLYFDIHVA